MENWEDRQACLLQSNLCPSVELFYGHYVFSMTLCMSRIFRLLDNLTWQDSKLSFLRVHIHCIFKKEALREACLFFFFFPQTAASLVSLANRCLTTFFFFPRKNLREQILLVIVTFSSAA